MQIIFLRTKANKWIKNDSDSFKVILNLIDKYKSGIVEDDHSKFISNYLNEQTQLQNVYFNLN